MADSYHCSSVVSNQSFTVNIPNRSNALPPKLVPIKGRPALDWGTDQYTCGMFVMFGCLLVVMMARNINNHRQENNDELSQVLLTMRYRDEIAKYQFQKRKLCEAKQTAQRVLSDQHKRLRHWCSERITDKNRQASIRKRISKRSLMRARSSEPASSVLPRIVISDETEAFDLQDTISDRQTWKQQIQRATNDLLPDNQIDNDLVIDIRSTSTSADNIHVQYDEIACLV